MISIILAGGAGIRLWPLSRKYWPKFLLKFGSSKFSLLQQTFLRIKEFTEINKIFIVVNEEHKFLVKENIQDLNVNFPLENIITEPELRNTLPAVTLACKVIKDRFGGNNVVGVFPSDHYIEDNKKFADYIITAEQQVKDNIILLGIKPTRPEQDYGYILAEKLYDRVNNKEFYSIKKFIEKPNYTKAKKLYKLNNIFWNVGIFIFSIETFFQELEVYQTDLFQKFQQFNIHKQLINLYENISSISIDKGLIEKTKKLLVLPINTFWDDLGSWLSLERIYEKDLDGKIILADKHIDMSSKNITVVAGKRLIVSCGLKDIVIVDTDDVLLVSHKSSLSFIKQIVEEISKIHSLKDSILYHKTISRPWGFYVILKQENGYKIKLINVLPQKKISLQKHKKRTEQWFVVSGVARIFYKNKICCVKKGDIFKIEKNTPHRLENPSKKNILEIIEVSYGSYLGEDDIIRLE